MNELQSAATPGGSGKTAPTAKPNHVVPSVANLQEKLKNSLTPETDEAAAGITALAQRIHKRLTIESRIDIRTRVTVSVQDDLLQKLPLHSAKHPHVPVGGHSKGDGNVEDDDDDDDSSNDEDGDVSDDDDSSNDEDGDVSDDDDYGDDNDDDDDYGGYDDYDDYGGYDDY